MALGAFVTGVMRLDADLFVPLRPGWIGLVASNAGTERLFLRRQLCLVRIVRVRLAGAVASLTRQGLVREFKEHLFLFGMAFSAGFPAREHGLVAGSLFEGIPPIPSVLAKR